MRHRQVAAGVAFAAVLSWPLLAAASPNHSILNRIRNSLQIQLHNGYLSADVKVGRRILSSSRIALDSALKAPDKAYGLLAQPQWTLLFGAVPSSERVIVNGYPATTEPLPNSVHSSYSLWFSLLPGRFSRSMLIVSVHHPLPFLEGKVVPTTLGRAQATAPFPLPTPSFLPPGGHLTDVRVAFPLFHVPNLIQVNLNYDGDAAWSLLVEDVGGHPSIGGGSRLKRISIGGRQAFVQVRPTPTNVVAIAMYFPTMTCILLGHNLSVKTLERIAASVSIR
jgi:hypothetical protein